MRRLTARGLRRAARGCRRGRRARTAVAPVAPSVESLASVRVQTIARIPAFSACERALSRAPPPRRFTRRRQRRKLVRAPRKWRAPTRPAVDAARSGGRTDVAALPAAVAGAEMLSRQSRAPRASWLGESAVSEHVQRRAAAGTPTHSCRQTHAYARRMGGRSTIVRSPSHQEPQLREEPPAAGRREASSEAWARRRAPLAPPASAVATVHCGSVMKYGKLVAREIFTR